MSCSCRAGIAADAREIFPGTASKDVVNAMPVAEHDREKMLMLHVSEKSGVQVIRKPIQVLLFASAAMRDFQFVAPCSSAKWKKNGVLLSIYLQPPPGAPSVRPGIVLDVPPERLLEVFPEQARSPARTRTSEAQRPGELRRHPRLRSGLDAAQREASGNVSKWVDRGGGLVVVGGPINTLQLARPGSNKDKLKPILDLYPVVLKDIRIDELDRKPDRPWPLIFEAATPDMEFLKLSDEVERGREAVPVGLERLLGRNPDNPDKSAVTRGFYNYYPVEQAKVGLHRRGPVHADPQSKDKKGAQMPFLVISDPASCRRVVWIGSGETWRLRQYSESFHERFWTKLVRLRRLRQPGNTTRAHPAYVGRTLHRQQVRRDRGQDRRQGRRAAQPQDQPARRSTIRLPAGVTREGNPHAAGHEPQAGQRRLVHRAVPGASRRASTSWSSTCRRPTTRAAAEVHRQGGQSRAGQHPAGLRPACTAWPARPTWCCRAWTRWPRPSSASGSSGRS